MRTRFAPLMFLLCAACAPAIAVEDDKSGLDDGGIDVGDSDTDAETDTDGAPDTGSEPEPDPEPSTADWAGEWVATIDLLAETDGGWSDQDITCVGEMALEFDDDGEVEGVGVCSIGGWAEAELYFKGDVDAEGDLDGVLTFVQDWIGESELDVSGSAADESEIDSDVDGVIVLGGWGGDYEVPLSGSMFLERE